LDQPANALKSISDQHELLWRILFFFFYTPKVPFPPPGFFFCNNVMAGPFFLFSLRAYPLTQVTFQSTQLLFWSLSFAPYFYPGLAPRFRTIPATGSSNVPQKVFLSFHAWGCFSHHWPFFLRFFFPGNNSSELEIKRPQFFLDRSSTPTPGHDPPPLEIFL